MAEYSRNNIMVSFYSLHFFFQVIVNGTEYQPSVASQNKKFAKAAAATAVLQEMGLVPRDS